MHKQIASHYAAYQDYIHHFDKFTEPIWKFLGYNTTKWTREASDAVQKLSNHLLYSPCWLNMSPDKEVRMEIRISTNEILILLLHRDPEHKQR